MMSSSFKHLLIGGVLFMGLSIGANANDLFVVNPPSLGDPTPKGYSTAVIIPAGKRIAFLSGQGGFDSKGELSPDFATQVKQAYVNIGLALEAIGAKPNQVVKLNVFVVGHDMSKLDVLTENVIRMFGTTPPAQTLISVPKLAIDPMLFEVEAVVALD
jgi:enamine deaminase RidA (YjgF/YER057c/UK114 family)